MAVVVEVQVPGDLLEFGEAHSMGRHAGVLDATNDILTEVVLLAAPWEDPHQHDESQVEPEPRGS